MDLQQWLQVFLDFARNSLLPLLGGLALLFFFWNVTRYIYQGTEPGARQIAKKYTWWSVIALFVIIFVWGIVNLFIITFGIGEKTDPITPDYMKAKGVENGVRLLLDEEGNF